MVPSFLVAVAVALGQSEPTKPNPEAGAEKAQFERWQTYYRRVASDYEMAQGKDRPTRLMLRPDPITSYANPAGGGRSHGSMFVWTQDGRPEIVGAIWSKMQGKQRGVQHEMHSLSLEPLTATRNGNLIWSPVVPGIEPFLIPDAPEPAKTSALRLVQMRRLASEFSASTIRSTTERPLQFRPQPLFRFEPPSAERDGAAFVGFEDWDPELLMLIELRATGDGPCWHAGFARFTNLPVSARHKNVQVWGFNESPAESSSGGFDKRFYLMRGVETLPVSGPE